MIYKKRIGVETRLRTVAMIGESAALVMKLPLVLIALRSPARAGGRMSFLKLIGNLETTRAVRVHIELKHCSQRPWSKL